MKALILALLLHCPCGDDTTRESAAAALQQCNNDVACACDQLTGRRVEVTPSGVTILRGR